MIHEQTSQSSLFLAKPSEIFISNVKAQGLYKEFQEGRSIVGKRYLQAQQLTRPQMAKSMMARAIRGGVKVDFFPYPNWSDSVGHPEFCTDKVVLKSSAIFFFLIMFLIYSCSHV
jgi:hypothetical protein